MKRKGYIDQILVFMVVFTAFVFMLFLVVGYANVSRVQYNLDTLSGVLARMISTGKTTDELVEKINSFKLPLYADIDSSFIVSDCNSSGSNKITVKLFAAYNPPIFEEFNITATSSAYNEQNSSDCLFTITFEQHQRN